MFAGFADQIVQQGSQDIGEAHLSNSVHAHAQDLQRQTAVTLFALVNVASFSKRVQYSVSFDQPTSHRGDARA